MKKITIGIALIILFVILLTNSTNTVRGSGQSVVVATLATSSTIQVGPQQNKLLFPSRVFCATRVIGTVGTAVQIAFGSTTVPSATIGLPILASTTNVLSSDNYSCSSITAYATASTTITLMETVQ